MPLSGKEMCKLFLKEGYEIVPGAGKGSHMKLKKRGYPMVIIPFHRELAPKTEHKLFKQLKYVQERNMR